MKLKSVFNTILNEAGLDTGRRTLGGSHLDRDQNVYSIDTVKDVVAHLNDKIDAPVKKAVYSTLGGDRNVSILVSISLDPKESWGNGIYENSRYLKFRIEQDGVIEQFLKSYKIPAKFRKTKAKSVADVISKINAYIASVK